MAVPALHHHAAAVRAPRGHSGQVEGDAGVGAVVAHVGAFSGRSQHAGRHRRREEVVAAVAGQLHQRAPVGSPASRATTNRVLRYASRPVKRATRSSGDRLGTEATDTCRYRAGMMLGAAGSRSNTA